MGELFRILSQNGEKNASIKKMGKDAVKHDYTDIIIINEDNRSPNGLVVTHLPEGPTAHFKLSNVKITKDLRKDWKQISAHRPEVILNNSTTRGTTSSSDITSTTSRARRRFGYVRWDRDLL